MSGYTTSQIWGIIIGLALGTFLIRLSFLALLRPDRLPPFALRVLRYTPVAVIPAMVAPLILWPEATGGQPDAARLAASVVTVVVGVWTRQTLWAAAAGGLTLAAALQVTG